MNTSKIDRRRDPSRTAKARAVACRTVRDQAVAAYASITPIILRMRAANMSLGQIADDLNEASYRTREGALFGAKTIARIIARAGVPTE